MILLSATLPLRRPAKEAHCDILFFVLFSRFEGVHDLQLDIPHSALFFYTFITHIGDVRVFIPRRAHSLWEGS